MASINWEQLPGVTSTPQLQAIRKFIGDEKLANRLLRFREDLFEAFLRTQDTSISTNEWSQQFENILRNLEAQGVIREFGFGNLILLQPELLDAYASALLIAVKDEPDGPGCVSEERVRQGQFAIPQKERLDNGVQEQLLLIAMTEELVHHELVLREGGFLLFPSQFTHEHPDYVTLAKKQSVLFTFAGPVLSIYTKLVVRLAQCGIFQKQELGQYVVIYTTQLGGSYGLLLSPQGEEQAELGLFFDEATDEETRFHFENFVWRHLEPHAGRTLQRRRLFVCPKCGKVFSETDVAYRQSHGSTFINCVCDAALSLLDSGKRFVAVSPSPVEQMEHEADIRRDEASAKVNQQGQKVVQEQCINIYIASTSEDDRLLSELLTHLIMLTKQSDIRFKAKRSMPPGTNWKQQISQDINQAHLILFLLSADYLKHCYEEMELATKRRDGRETSEPPILIPLLMRPVDNWEATPIGDLEPLPGDRIPVVNKRNREEAMRNIAENIRRVIEQIRQDLAQKGA